MWPAAFLGLLSCAAATPDDEARRRHVWVDPAAAAGSSSLQQVLDEAADAQPTPTTVHLGPGRHPLPAPLKLDHRHSGMRFIGHGSGGEASSMSGGVAVGEWLPEPGRGDWLFRATLPARLQHAGTISQVWVAGQRRGAARSVTSRFANVTSNGLQAGPRQLLPHYSNVSTMRCMIYQQWTASFQPVVAIGSPDVITLDRQPPAMSGNGPSGSRYFLENAPEYLAPGSGTFYADSTSILYAPLDVETVHFAAAELEVVAAVPAMYALVDSTNVTDLHWESVVFEHTDAEFSTCFASTCAFQSATWLKHATVRFGFSQRISMINVTVQHTGGYGIWFGPGVRQAELRHSKVLDMGAGGVRIGEETDLENGTEHRTARNVTVADCVIHDGGNVFRAGMGVLLQAAADCTITHNEVSMFRQTGISAGWRWNYGPTSDGNTTISYNRIHTIGMGETSDLGCVYHLGRDRGTTIHNNLCYNVSSFDYGGLGFYLDQASQYVTVTDNVAYDVKCAGFLQNFGLNCTISNNVLASVNQNIFWPGADFSGQTCANNCGSAVWAASTAIDPIGPGSGFSAFTFTQNVVSWQTGPLFGGGSSLLSSSFAQNLYWNTDAVNGSARAQLQATGFPCPEAYGPLDPLTANGVMYGGQSLLGGQVLLSHSKAAWAALRNQSFCVGRGTQAGSHELWCSPAPAQPIGSARPQSRVTMQGDGNLCECSGPDATSPCVNGWCAMSCSPTGCPQKSADTYYAVLHDNGTYCVYGGSYPSGRATWCTNSSSVDSDSNPTVSEEVHSDAGAGSGCSFATWQGKGYDTKSVVADPLFVNPEAHDFRLKPNSPALALGIRSIDMSTVGPRPLKTDDTGDAGAAVAATATAGSHSRSHRPPRDETMQIKTDYLAAAAKDVLLWSTPDAAGGTVNGIVADVKAKMAFGVTSFAMCGYDIAPDFSGLRPQNGSGAPSRRRDCHFADIPSPSILKHLLKVEGGCSRMTVSPTAQAPLWSWSGPPSALQRLGSGKLLRLRGGGHRVVARHRPTRGPRGGGSLPTRRRAAGSSHPR